VFELRLIGVWLVFHSILYQQATNHTLIYQMKNKTLASYTFVFWSFFHFLITSFLSTILFFCHLIHTLFELRLGKYSHQNICHLYYLSPISKWIQFYHIAYNSETESYLWFSRSKPLSIINVQHLYLTLNLKITMTQI